MNDSIILETKNLKFGWSKNSELLFSGLDLTIEKEKITCILGPSGCGKTTLLNLAAGFLTPTGGEVIFKGKPIRKPEKSRIMVFQDYNQLFPWKTILKNVTFPMADRNSELARKLLSLSGLEGVESLYPSALSGGMKQRAAIARALAAEPELLLLDEPFDGLDAPLRKGLQNTILNLEGEMSASIMMVTHDIDEAVFLADRILVLGNGGKIILKRKNPLKEPGNRDTADFLDLKAELYSLIEGERTL